MLQFWQQLYLFQMRVFGQRINILISKTSLKFGRRWICLNFYKREDKKKKERFSSSCSRIASFRTILWDR